MAFKLPSELIAGPRPRLTAGLLLTACLLLLLSLSAMAAPDDPDALDEGAEVSLTVSGGEVVGKVRGQGKASVVATVENLGTRFLKGIRIAAAYNTVDENPGAEGNWYVHEFVFEPPLKPGGKSTLRFSDNSAAEYVALELRRAVYSLGVSYNGRVANQQDALVEQDGVTYMSTRDFIALVGGSLSFEAKSGYVVLEREGVTLKIKKGKKSALLGSKTVTLDESPLEIDSRSYLPVESVAGLLNLSVTQNTAENLIELSN